MKNKCIVTAIIVLCGLVLFYYPPLVMKEGFSKTYIILMGDSILNNEAYVDETNTIENQLKQNTSDSILSLAKDHATVYDTFSQLDQIPSYFNVASTNIILSVGGNNLLTTYLYREENVNIDLIFEDYEKLIMAIKKSMNKATLYVLDIYYPTSHGCKKYHSLIHSWNQELDRVAERHTIQVIKISERVTDQQDFINDIEPSPQGAKRITNMILDSINNTK